MSSKKKADVTGPDAIVRVYESFEKLEKQGEKATDSYGYLLSAVKGDNKVKTLVAQFIPRFFHLFAKKSKDAINAQLDLCEDEDVSIRVYAIKGLAEIAKRSPSHASHISDVLVQLLQAEAGKELETVKRAIATLLEVDAQSALDSLFQQIRQGEELLKERSLSFFREHLPRFQTHITTNTDIQRHFMQLLRGVLELEGILDAKDYSLFVDSYTSLSLFTSDKTTRDELVTIFVKQCKMEEKFDPSNYEVLRKFITVLSFVPSLHSKEVDTNTFSIFFFSTILPQLDQLADQKYLLLKSMTEVVNTHTAPSVVNSLPFLITAFQKCVPTREIGGKIEFSLVECLLYMIHSLGSNAPTAFRKLCGIVMDGQPSDPEMDEKRKDFFDRLVYLKDSVKTWAIKIREALKKSKEVLSQQTKEKAEEKEKQNTLERIKNLEIALKTTSNIEFLVNKLLSKPLIFINKINPSWGNLSQPQKKRGPPTPAKIERPSKVFYTPPKKKRF